LQSGLGVSTSVLMRAIASILVFLLVAASLRSQCGCGATTIPVNPMPSIPGPPAWSVSGTITDTGTTSGTCIAPQPCPGPKVPCKHNLFADMSIRFPAGTNPPPVLRVKISDGVNVVGADLPPSSGVVNGDGTWTFRYQYPLYVELACGQNGSISLTWSMPGGAPGNQSGSVTLTCGNC
jgi:hypothetical protein